MGTWYSIAYRLLVTDYIMSTMEAKTSVCLGSFVFEAIKPFFFGVYSIYLKMQSGIALHSLSVIWLLLL